MSRLLRLSSSLPLLLLIPACGGGGGGGGAPIQLPASALVKDLDTASGERGSLPNRGIEFLGEFYFSASQPETGHELYKTDGTAAGTELVLDIVPGREPSFPSGFLVAGPQLFFTAQDDFGRELWVTDGTASGTRRVADHNPGLESSSPALFVSQGSTVLLSLVDPVLGRELFRTDGVEIDLVKDLNPGSSPSNPTVPLGSNLSSFVELGGRWFFRAENSISGVELWVTDGTAAGTQLFVDIEPGASSGEPRWLVEMNGKIYFSARAGGMGRELWVTDGTKQGTKQVVDLNPGASSSTPQYLFVAGDLILFQARAGEGTELYKTDGTAAGTVLVKDIRPGGINDSGQPTEFRMVNGVVLFRANDGVYGNELWRTDGTEAGTVLLKDVHQGSRSSSVSWLGSIPGATLFAADNAAIGKELWTTDGTASGTQPVLDIYPGRESNGDANDSSPRSVGVFAGAVMLSAADGVHGREMWSATATTARLLNLVPDGTSSANPSRLTKFQGRVIFRARSVDTGYELFSTDGTEAGTALVSDVRAGTRSGPTGEIVELEEQLLFVSSSETMGTELFRTDGTAAGTALVRDINPGVRFGQPRSSSVQYLTRLGDTVLFSADDGVAGRELWTSDGTTIGTRMVKDIDPRFSSSGTARSSAPQDLIEYAGKIYFSAEDPDFGQELYVSDGTTGGTQLFADLEPGTDGSRPIPLGVIGGRLLFATQSGARSLFATDGTAAGIERLDPSATTGLFSGEPAMLATLSGRAILAGRSFGEFKLVSTDGSAAGTVVLKALPYILNFGRAAMVVGEFVWFSASDGELGQELWRTDGTPAGTTLALDIYTGVRSADPNEFYSPDGVTGYFAAADAARGRELWRVNADGSVEFAVDIYPGPADGVVGREMTHLNGQLLLSADNGKTGAELFRVPLVR